MRLLLDTCALVWWTLDPSKLSKKIITTLNQSELFISSISIWEIGLKIKNGKLDIGMTIETFTDKLKELGTLTLIPVTEEIWMKNLKLNWDHKDPANRTIVATAQLNHCHIITTDKEIIKFYKKTLH